MDLNSFEDISIRLSFMVHHGCLSADNIKDVSHLPGFYLREMH